MQLWEQVLEPWVKILFLLYSTIILAISVSRIRDSAADVFSETVSKLATVCSNLFCNAPKAEWLEIMTNYLNGIQQKDKVLLLDCLEYALIPYLEKTELLKQGHIIYIS